MPFDLPALDARFAALVIVVVVAGLARGMSGFGTGMIVAPVASALYSPQIAVPMLSIVDSLPTMPVSIPSLRLAQWREVLPILAGLAAFLPAGVYLLAHVDAVVLRWLICFAILACAAVLRLGWRYHGSRAAPISFGVGGVAGVLSGIAAIPGPPVIFYWMASDLPARLIRANLMSLFLISEVLSIGSFWTAGLLTRTVIGVGVAVTPCYFVALLVGSKLHGLASEDSYRRVTFVLILVSAVLALPVIQPLLEQLAALLGKGAA